MGVDAEIKFKTKEALDKGEVEKIVKAIWLDIETVCDNVYKIENTWRYYDIDYERGPVIEIFGLFRFLRDYLGDNLEAIYYNRDCEDSNLKLTTDREEEIWQHFIKFGHEPYDSCFNKYK